MASEEQQPKVNSSGSRVVKDLAAGTVGGWAQVMVGQPFDIIKVRLQSSDTYSGMMNCASRTLSEEGPLAFYKGTAMPLFGIGACVSIQFGVLESVKRWFGSINPPDQKKLSTTQLFLAGAAGGVGNSVISSPVEHIRIRLQTQPSSLSSSNPSRLNGPLDALKKVYERGGGLRGVYRGLGITVWREFIGYGSYFACYEKIVQWEMDRKGIERKDIPTINSVIFGAIAGYALWFTAYPFDVLKSRMQTDGLLPPSSSIPHLSTSSTSSSKAPTSSRPYSTSTSGGVGAAESPLFQPARYRNTVECARELWRTAGWRGFLRGLTPTLIRSPFVNGATFAGFEVTIRMLG